MAKVSIKEENGLVELHKGELYLLSGKFSGEYSVPVMDLLSFENRGSIFEYLDSRDKKEQEEVGKLFNQQMKFEQQGNYKMVQILENTIKKKLGHKAKGKKEISLYIKDNNHREFEHGYIPTREDKEKAVSSDMIAIFTNNSNLIEPSKWGYREIATIDANTTLYQLT